MRPHAMGAFALLALANCQIISGYEDFTAAPGAATASVGGGGSGEGGASGAGGSGQSGAAVCEQRGLPPSVDSTRGPSMAATVVGIGYSETAGIEAPSCAWIDQTEVSFAEYQGYLNHPDGPSKADPTCAAAEAPAARAECLGSVKPTMLPTDVPNLPVVCVNACDAASFCRWAGKSLCAGGVQASRFQNPLYMECSGGGRYLVPYGNVDGNTQKKEQCSDYELPAAEGPGCATTDRCLQAPGSLPTCKTAAGVADLVGNVEEWTGDCSSGAERSCDVRGGSRVSDYDTAVCPGLRRLPASLRAPSIGFRCCAPGDPL